MMAFSSAAFIVNLGAQVKEFNEIDFLSFCPSCCSVNEINLCVSETYF